jgi:hypothetical protein
MALSARARADSRDPSPSQPCVCAPHWSSLTRWAPCHPQSPVDSRRAETELRCGLRGLRSRRRIAPIPPTVSASSSADLSLPLGYKIRVLVDLVGHRCHRITVRKGALERRLEGLSSRRARYLRIVLACRCGASIGQRLRGPVHGVFRLGDSACEWLIADRSSPSPPCRRTPWSSFLR